MGRTNPTYRMQLRRLEHQWRPYRRSLRADDQPHFDRLFEHAQTHADAAGQLNPTHPMIAALVSVALEQEKRITELEARLESPSDGDRGGRTETEPAEH